MKTILGLGTALTLAIAPMALEAKPKFKVQGGNAVTQMLGAAVSGNAKALQKAEKKLRKAARKAGVPVSVATVTAAATGGAAVASTSRTTTARAATPAPRFAPIEVAQRPRARPAQALAIEAAAATPPVTTLRDGMRIETTALDTTPSVTPLARRVSTDASAQVSAEPVTTVSTAKVVTVDSDTASTLPAPEARLSTASTQASVTPVSDARQASQDVESSIFGGPTGY